ncbi:MAG: DUF5115 domain-containing protein [Prevotella sp.]|nr:DUF5115 domain-containing protein [Prevotella sp.]
MKRIALYALLLATGMLAGCSDDFTDWADPQGYGPEESELILFDATGVDAIAMEDVTDDYIAIFTPSVTVPDGAVVTGYEVVLDETVTLEADTEGKVAVADLQTAVETLYGKRPEAHTMTEVINVLVELDGQVLTNSATTTLTVTLSAPFIASAYYLVGDFCGWDEETMIAFSHSDADVYDDPTFTVTFTTDAGQYWKIIPQTNIDSGDFWHEGSDGVVGVADNGDTSLSGQLVAIEGVGAGQIADAGMYRMTINMMDYTYTISALAGEYYLTGNPNGWADDARSMLYPEGDNVYSYTSQFNASWDAKIWSGDDLGDWDNIYGCAGSMDNTPGDGTLVYSNGDQSTIGCLTSPAEGLYTLYVDMGTMTYSWEELSDQAPTEYNLVSITGDFNGWGDYIDMTEVAPHNWYVEANIPSDGGLKFLVDHDWGVNWGATFTVSTETYYGVGTQDGDNITVPAGDYRIYLNDITGKFIFVAE